MNHYFSYLLIFVCSLAYSLNLNAQRAIDQLESQDYVRFDSAISLMDNGKPKDAIKIIDDLRKKYNNNYFLEYERLYAYSQLGEYKRVVKEGSKLFDHPDATSHCYQLVGNAQDILGNADVAMKTYDEGIMRFPNAGNLYLEKGNLFMAAQQYDKALDYYMQGVRAQPDFASNYYRLAKLYAASTEPLWAVFYGEVVCNLQPGSKRYEEMGRLIYDVFNKNIRVDDSNRIQVTMTDEGNFFITSMASVGQLPFSSIYEIGLTKNPNFAKELIKTKKLTIRQIAEMRKSALEYVDSMSEDLSSISLLDYHRKLMNSVNWHAYNMWLMAPGAPDEAEQWINTKEGEEQAEKLNNWMMRNRFVPTKEKPTLKEFNTNVFSIPDIEELETADGCRQHREDALRIAKWYLEQPSNPQNATQQEAIQFLIAWMAKTDEFTFFINGGVRLHEKIFPAYLASMVKQAITSNVSKTDKNIFCKVMQELIGYYKENKNTIGTIEAMEEYLKMDETTLLDTLSEEYEKYSKSEGQ